MPVNNTEPLISNCLLGDHKATSELYNLYAEKMYGVCLNYAKNKNDAKDILQEGFIKIFRNLQKYRNEGSFEGWIRKIMVNTAISYSRQSGNLHVSCEGLEDFMAEHKNPIDKLLEKDLRFITEKLSRGYKIVFYLRAVEGYSHEQIAEKLGISCNTSKSQYCRARNILQKMVVDHNRVVNPLAN